MYCPHAHTFDVQEIIYVVWSVHPRVIDSVVGKSPEQAATVLLERQLVDTPYMHVNSVRLLSTANDRVFDRNFRKHMTVCVSSARALTPSIVFTTYCC
jgi:hypothetical protein